MRWHWVLAVGWVVVCYMPVSPEAHQTQTTAVRVLTAATPGPDGPRIDPHAPPSEVYRRVKLIAEEYLRPLWPRPAEVWQRPWNYEQAVAEFRSFEERVRRLEGERSGTPLVAAEGPSRMFADWRRIDSSGVETACETDAALPPCGGPEGEVVLGTGEVMLGQTDLSLPVRGGVGFSLVRYYRSRVDYNGPLGPGWDHNCNQRIVAEEIGSSPVSLVWYTGQRAIRFKRQGQDWEPEPGAFYRLRMEANNVVVETPERMRLEFEPAEVARTRGQAWRIARIAGRHGQWQANVLRFHYWPGSDVLSFVEDPYGNKVRFFHDAHGRLTGVQYDALVVRYQYDDAGRLSQVTIPRVALRLAHVEDVTWQYRYVRDFEGRSWLRAVIGPGGLSEKVFDYELTADRPDYGWVVRVSRRVCDSKADPEEAAWTFSAKQRGDVWAVTYRPPSPLPEEEWTFPLVEGRVSCYPLTRQIASQKAKWQYTHNIAGQLIEERLPLGGIRRWHYDSANPDPRFRGNLLEQEELGRAGSRFPGIQKRGWRWTYHPEIASHVTAVAYEVSREGNEQVLLRSRSEYDPVDLDLVVEQIGDRVRRIVRNRYGLPVVEWDGRGCATVYRYYSRYNMGALSSADGGLEGERVEDASPEEVAAALGSIGHAKVDQMPVRKAEGPPCNRSQHFRYDQYGQLVKEESPGYQVARLWNKLGQLLAVLDSRADLVVYDYDTALRQTGRWRRIERLVGASYLGETRLDAAGYFTAERLTYDALGRLVAWNPTLERLGLENPVLPEVRYEYYPSGQLKKRITPAGTAIEIEYDEKTGRPRTIRLLPHDKSQKPLVLRAAMVYDAEGALISYQDARGETYRAEADAFGRVWATVRPDGVREQILRDGLDRPVYEQVYDAEGRLVDEREYQYDSTNRLVKIRQRRLVADPDATGRQKPIDQWLVAEEAQYDPEGNVLARRGWREGAWEKFGYDGLGRLVWREFPTGDRWQAFYQDDWLCVETQTFSRPGQGEKATTFTLHTVTLRDARGFPWCSVPVGYDGTMGIRRARVMHYDSQGNLAFELLPKTVKTLRFFNTLGFVVQEQVWAAENKQLLAQTVNSYEPDGLLVRREVYNEPLVFSSLDSPWYVRFERREVPQVRTFRYDSFRRLWRETAPDGLVEEYDYGPDSRVTQLTRYHLSEPDQREVLQFAYDRLGRLQKILTVGEGTQARLIQQFDYDWQDNIVRAWDHGQPEHPVLVKRLYDNLGFLLREQISLPNDNWQEPAIVFDYDPPAGKLGAQFVGFEDQSTGWRRLEVQQDLAGNVRQIIKDGREFCRFEFVGQRVAAKHLPSLRLTEEISRLDPFLEPLEQRLVENGRPDSPIYQMHYLRDQLGRVTASSIRVPSKGWECSKIYDRDYLGNLTAEDTLGRFFEPEQLEQKREGLLTSGGPLSLEDIGVYHVRRYEYDQAGNLIASFHGKPTATWPQGTETVSSWDPLLTTREAGVYQSPRILLTSRAPSHNAQPVSLVPGVAQAPDPQVKTWALASNRPVCKAVVEEPSAQKARLGARYQYDRFGRLTDYDSQATGQPIHWQIEYDVLGRVVSMKGSLAAPQDVHDSNQKSSQAESGYYELRFAYDPFNRRILKEIRKKAGPDGPLTEHTVHAMLYTGQRPAIKLCKSAAPSQSWTIEGQYIWGAGQSEILAYYERVDAQGSASAESLFREYLLHQDVALNVLLSTHRSHGRPDTVEIGDVASYWGLGENSTTGVIVDATSSLPVEKGHEARWAIDRTLDNQSAHWIGGEQSGNEPGFLTLKLSRKERLTAMTVWADKLPDEFRLYVVPAGKAPQREEPLATWERAHSGDKVWEAKADAGIGGKLSPVKPTRMLLGGREGQEIVFIWDRCPGGVQVREFEVFVQPMHPGDLAFSGAIYDAETGLYYHGARYRLPELGTFISPDPLGFLGGDNLYAFAHNDPLTWHDPDGQLAHILIGAGVGGALGAASYVLQWWWSGEEWDWARFGIYTTAGAAAGALSAATGGAALAWAGHGLGATWSAVIAGAVAGGAGGAAYGAVQAGGITYLETGNLGVSVRAAALAGLREGALGAVGGVVGGSVAARLGASVWGFVGSGMAGGAAVGALREGYEGYRNTGTIGGALTEAFRGAIEGAIIGGVIGGAAWGVGRSAGWIRRLPEQPEGLPDPRSKGLLIRTKGPAKRQYGGVPVKPGFARHHIKPLSLGGSDTPDNIVEIPMEIHRQPHPGPDVTRAPVGTIFY